MFLFKVQCLMINKYGNSWVQAWFGILPTRQWTGNLMNSYWKVFYATWSPMVWTIGGRFYGSGMGPSSQDFRLLMILVPQVKDVWCHGVEVSVLNSKDEIMKPWKGFLWNHHVQIQCHVLAWSSWVVYTWCNQQPDWDSSPWINLDTVTRSNQYPDQITRDLAASHWILRAVNTHLFTLYNIHYEYIYIHIYIPWYLHLCIYTSRSKLYVLIFDSAMQNASWFNRSKRVIYDGSRNHLKWWFEVSEIVVRLCIVHPASFQSQDLVVIEEAVLALSQPGANYTKARIESADFLPFSVGSCWVGSKKLVFVWGQMRELQVSGQSLERLFSVSRYNVQGKTVLGFFVSSRKAKPDGEILARGFHTRRFRGFYHFRQLWYLF